MRCVGRFHTRRLIMPLVILAVAAGLWITMRQQEKPQAEAVQQFIHQLCADVATGRKQSLTVTQANRSVVGQAVVARLRELLEDRPEVMDHVMIDVAAGDHPDFGDGSATHTAILRINGDEMLGLRIVHRGRAQNIEILIIGFWTPQGGSA